MRNPIDGSPHLYINLSVAIGTLDPLSGSDVRLRVERFGHKRNLLLILDPGLGHLSLRLIQQ